MSYGPNQMYPGATELDPNYPKDKFKDNNPSTTNNGTPLKAIKENQDLTLETAVMNDAGFEYNGLPDTPQNSQLFKAYKASLGNGTNLLSNHNFLIQTPDDSQPLPSATPTSYPPGYQIFSGVFANETTGITNLTYIDGRVSFSGGDLYFAVPNTGAIARLTSAQLTASVADFDGKPRTRGVSFALVGDEYRVTVGIDALEDAGSVLTPLGSVKFEQGSVATGHAVGYFTGSIYYADSLNDAKSNSSQVKSIIIKDRANAPFKRVDQATYDSYPDLAKFTDNSGQLWGIAATSRVDIEWFYEEGEQDHAPAWQACFDLKARYMQAIPGFEYQWLTPQHTDQYGNKYWTTPRANFKIFGNDSTINTANLGNVNLSIMSTRFAPSPIGVYEVEKLIVRAANRSPGTDKIVRTCFDAFNVMKTKIVDCTWYGGDHSTLVGCDNNNPKARMDVIRPNVFNVLTIQIDPADTSFFYGHCANGSIKGGLAFQDGVDLAQFCEVNESNWEVSGNRAFGFRVFSFVDNGGYVSQYTQETSRIIFSKNIVSCMNAFVTPTDASHPFRPGGKVSNITISDNQVLFIPTIAGRSELVQGIFAPSDQNGNGVETVENIVIDNNLITFADFGAQTTDCRFLSIKSKFARVISFTNNTVRGWNAAMINVDTLEALTWSNNKISLRYGDITGPDAYSLYLRAVNMSDVDFNNNNWGIITPPAQKQVMYIQFTSASNLSFTNEHINNGNVTSYFYMGVSYQKLLDSGVRLVNIPLKAGGFSIPGIANGQIGVSELNLFDGGVLSSREIDVTIENIVSGQFPSEARFLSKFRLGSGSPLLSAPVYACQGDVSATTLTSLVNVTLNTNI